MSSRLRAMMLIVDMDDGEGRTYASDDWQELDPLTKLDCLRDWRYELDMQYNQALVDWREQLEEISFSGHKPMLRIVGVESKDGGEQ